MPPPHVAKGCLSDTPFVAFAFAAESTRQSGLLQASMSEAASLQAGLAQAAAREASLQASLDGKAGEYRGAAGELANLQQELAALSNDAKVSADTLAANRGC